jgi:hypothetical protein
VVGALDGLEAIERPSEKLDFILGLYGLTRHAQNLQHGGRRPGRGDPCRRREADLHAGTGQITVGRGTTLATEDTYSVEVTATGSAGASASITVTITLTSLLNEYDEDGDQGISKSEAISAVRDYFGGRLSKEQTIAVIRLYFASGG